MIILIDGYNLLKQVFHKVKGKLDKQRQQLIKELGFYKHKKEIKEIIVVFDGGLINHATREIKHGITIIFSGRKQTADDWILDHIEKYKNNEYLLVSLDRELKQKASVFGVDSIDVFDFYKILQNCLQDDAKKYFTKNGMPGELLKYETNKEDIFENFEQKVDTQALDLLMEEASLNGFDFEKDDFHLEKNKKKGKEKTLSRKEKRYDKKIKKL